MVEVRGWRCAYYFHLGKVPSSVVFDSIGLEILKPMITEFKLIVLMVINAHKYM